MSVPSGFTPDPEIRCRDHRIGAIGAGFIMADVHLAAYREAGFPVVAIASRSPDKARAVAERWGIPRVHDTPAALIEDREVEILDIAFPPDQQPALIRHALRQPHIRAILAQKPLAMDHAEAQRLAAEAAAAGKILSVNQNMRFDQSMRVLKQLLDRNALGTPVLATHRDAGDPALAALPRDLWPADPAQHEHPPSRRAALPVRRPGRDLHRGADRPAHRLRASRRHLLLHPVLPQRADGGEPGGCLVRPARRGLRERHLHQVAGRGHRGPGPGHHRLAGLSEGQPQHPGLLRAGDRRQVGAAAAGTRCGSRTPSRA